MAEKRGIALASVSGFPADAAGKLAGLWITTVQELVGAAHVSGTAGLAEALGVPEAEVTRLVDLAAAALPPGAPLAPSEIRRHGLGSRDQPRDEEPPARGPFAAAPLAPKIDLHGRMPAVRDQGQRGTCVAHASAAVREYLMGEAKSAGANLSEQFLYWECKQNDGDPNAEGTWIEVAMSCLKATGVCREQDWPYNPQPMPGNESQDPPPAAAAQAAAYRIVSSTKLPAHDIPGLRQALCDGKPIAFGVPVYTYWFADPVQITGDLRLPLSSDNFEGNHAMCMVGYEDDGQVPGGGFFMVRNSWGTAYAPQSAIAAGYMRIPYAYIQQYGAATHVADAPPEEDVVPPEPEPKPEPPPSKSWFEQLLDWLQRLFGFGG